jgi:hypothetical protein
MGVALRHGTEAFSGGMRGYVIETTSLDGLEIPDEVIRKPSLRLEIGVTHHRPPGAAWAQLVIVVVFAESGGYGQRA